MSLEVMGVLQKHPQRDEIVKSFKYMSEVFCKRNNKKLYYKISSAFFNYLLFAQKLSSNYCDGLAYPSANTERAGMNVVLKRHLIDDKTLYCTSATMYSMIRKHSQLQISACSLTSHERTQQSSCLCVENYALLLKNAIAKSSTGNSSIKCACFT